MLPPPLLAPPLVLPEINLGSNANDNNGEKDRSQLFAAINVGMDNIK